MATLNFLTLPLLKAHIRLDSDFDDDELLTQYGASAEQEALDFLECDLTDLYEVFGEVPTPIIQACAERAATYYKFRETDSDRAMHHLAYRWEGRLLRYKSKLKI